MAEQRKVGNWKQFKERYLSSFFLLTGVDGHAVMTSSHFFISVLYCTINVIRQPKLLSVFFYLCTLTLKT